MSETKTPEFIWDVGTAYDLFISLDVLHDPSRYGLRGNWAAGVRSRLPVKHREFLQQINDHHLVWPIIWLAHLDGPKDSATILETISQIPAADRLPEMTKCQQPDEVREVLTAVSARKSWTKEDKSALRSAYKEMMRKEGKKKKIKDEELESTLTHWADTAAFGEQYLAAMQSYYKVFFREEEQRIVPALKESVSWAQKLAKTVTLPEMLDELSQGLRYDLNGETQVDQILMIPSFWTTPLAAFFELEKQSGRWLFLFGGRPSGISLVPGEQVPELLHQTLKALADPTRLRILRYLAEEPLTPAELARRLRLRPPTVIHHLDALRLARLVHVTLSYQGRRYEARQTAVHTACEMLEEFLTGGE
jgi:DNA-binding transcriptional ArsR family regulator